ncbi:hypothetical protein [Streptomyces sp. OE57]|uniref:MmyB family transcriptional regulator n=1 Tax=Streptomyces lacaronensis TaxID=3379885 RepID=UPI0039B77800
MGGPTFQGMGLTWSFVRLWARHDVGSRTHGRVTIAHPRAGTLTLDLERFPVPSAPGQ